MSGPTTIQSVKYTGQVHIPWFTLSQRPSSDFFFFPFYSIYKMPSFNLACKTNCHQAPQWLSFLSDSLEHCQHQCWFPGVHTAASLLSMLQHHWCDTADLNSIHLQIEMLIFFSWRQLQNCSQNFKKVCWLAQEISHSTALICVFAFHGFNHGQSWSHGWSYLPPRACNANLIHSLQQNNEYIFSPRKLTQLVFLAHPQRVGDLLKGWPQGTPMIYFHQSLTSSEYVMVHFRHCVPFGHAHVLKCLP